MFIRTAAFPLLLLCLACAGESPNAEPETVSNELVPDAARAPSCDPASDDLTLPEGFCATVFVEDLGRSRHLAVTDDGIVYVSQHGRDSLDTLWPDLFTSEQSRDNPAEEFFKLTDGDDYMWPYCYWDTALDKKILAPNTVVTARKSVTAIWRPTPWWPSPRIGGRTIYSSTPESSFPSAIAAARSSHFRGSWNRAPFPQGGYNVVFIPMPDGAVTGDWEIFADGFKDEDPLMSPGDATYRPTGLAQGPDGSMYISDSVTGRIWRVAYTGS